MILLKINDNCICCSKYLLFPLSVQSKQYWAIPVGGDWPSKPSCEIDYKLRRQKKKVYFGWDSFLNTTAVTLEMGYTVFQIVKAV